MAGTSAVHTHTHKRQFSLVFLNNEQVYWITKYQKKKKNCIQEKAREKERERKVKNGESLFLIKYIYIYET